MWGNHHVRKIRISTTKSIPCQWKASPANHENISTNGALLPILWLLAASCCLSVGCQDPTDLFYMSRAESSGKGSVKSLTLPCPGSTAPENASMLKNSKLGQNDGVLRITNSIFVQTVSLCCLHLLFSLIIRIVLHVRKNTNTALTVTSHSQLLLSRRDWDDPGSDGGGGCSRIRSSSRSSCSSRIRHFELILLILIKNCMELALSFWYFWDVVTFYKPKVLHSLLLHFYTTVIYRELNYHMFTNLTNSHWVELRVKQALHACSLWFSTSSSSSRSTRQSQDSL